MAYFAATKPCTDIKITATKEKVPSPVNEQQHKTHRKQINFILMK